VETVHGRVERALPCGAQAASPKLIPADGEATRVMYDLGVVVAGGAERRLRDLSAQRRAARGEAGRSDVPVPVEEEIHPTDDEGAVVPHGHFGKEVRIAVRLEEDHL